MATVRWGVQTEGIKGLSKALKTLADPSAPFLHSALGKGGRVFEGHARSEAPRHVASSVAFVGVTGTGANQKAVIKATAPDAARQELGRAPKPYRVSGKGRRAVFGIKRRGYVYRGSKPRPYFGIKRMDHAIARSESEIKELLATAVKAEWDRVGAGD